MLSYVWYYPVTRCQLTLSNFRRSHVPWTRSTHRINHGSPAPFAICLVCTENSVSERPFRAYIAYLASGKARHVKTAKKKTLKNNAPRRWVETPKNRGMGVTFSATLLRPHSAQRKARS